MNVFVYICFLTDVQVPASTLNLTQVNRADMAVYMCTADNGVPPMANMTYVLEVHCKYFLIIPILFRITYLFFF